MVGSGIRKKPIPDPGSGGQKGTGSQIPDPDPQHCSLTLIPFQTNVSNPQLKPFNAQSLNWNLEQDQGSLSDRGKIIGMVSVVPVPQHWARILKILLKRTTEIPS
jgi:hypothetical protein